MGKLQKAKSLLIRLESGLLVLVLCVLVLMSFYQVILRQLFHTGLLWADTLLRHLVLWVGFLGASLATAQGQHFAWETSSPKGGKTKALMRLIAQLSTIVVTALFIKASWQFLCDEKKAGDMLFKAGAIAVPAWVFSSIIPAGFFLIFLHTVIESANFFAEFKK